MLLLYVERYAAVTILVFYDELIVCSFVDDMDVKS